MQQVGTARERAARVTRVDAFRRLVSDTPWRHGGGPHSSHPRMASRGRWRFARVF